MSFPKEKYKYFVHGNEVVAISTYGGKRVKGIAKCDPRDEFDIEKGKAIAAARCNYKIAKKRYKVAREKRIMFGSFLEEIEKERKEIYNYYTRALNDLSIAEKEIEQLREEN